MPTRGGSPERLAAAIADHERIDWDRVDERDAVVQQLKAISAIAAAAPPRPELPLEVLARTHLRGVPAAIVAIGTLRITIGVACLAATIVGQRHWPPGVVSLFAVIVAVFSTSSTVLLRSNKADRRAAELGTVFLLVATSYANGLYGTALSRFPAVLLLLRSFPVDALLPYALWRFVEEFPTALKLPAARHGRRFERVCLVVGLVLIAATCVSTLFPSSQLGSAAQRLARRSAKGTVYWTVVFGFMLPVLPALAVRTMKAGHDARRRGWLFLTGILIGLLPLSVNIVLETASTRYRALSTANRPIVVGIATAFLLTIPVTTAYAVQVTRVLTVRVVLRRTLMYALARTTLLTVTLLPFAFLLFRVYVSRDLPVSTVFGGASARWLLVLAAAGGVLLATRAALVSRLDRLFFQHVYDRDEVITNVVEEMRGSRTIDEIAAAIGERLTQTLQLHAATLMTANDTGTLLSPMGTVAPLERTTALYALLAASPAPFYVDFEREPGAISRLPEPDLFWLVDHDIRALVPVHGARGELVAVLVLGGAKSDESLRVAHGAVLSALGSSLAPAIERCLRTGTGPDEAGPASGVRRAMECERCGSVLPADASMCTCGGQLAAALVPELVAGKFMPTHRIGRGGMGVVYRAIDRTLDRPVALKTLPKVSVEHSVRLRREARTMAALAHPALATVYGIESWRGQPMVVVEYLDGGTLADRLRRGGVSPAEWKVIGCRVLEALAHVHANGFLHRDVKPSNIGFTASNAAKLLDFGLASLTEHSAAPKTPLSAPLNAPGDYSLTDRFVGTPAYMPPEAFRGETPTASFDLWGCAVVMAEVLSGEYPFGAVALALSRLSAGTVPEFVPAVERLPASIVDFLREALHTDPLRRPANAEVFRSNVEALFN
jgi:hypothetical protein